MKPNHEQDDDRAAFERLAMAMEWSVVRMGGHYYDSEVECAWIAYQAAKADSRAMQDAFEQVCVEAEKVQQWQSDDGIAPYYDLAKALSLAAPFRKTGV